jgi:hypothetical protein
LVAVEAVAHTFTPVPQEEQAPKAKKYPAAHAVAYVEDEEHVAVNDKQARQTPFYRIYALKQVKATFVIALT